MNESLAAPSADRKQLQQIIAGLTEGVILVEPDQTIAWANPTALVLHGVSKLAELGGTVSEYRKRYELKYRNNHELPPGDYPMERLLVGEAFSEAVVEVTRPGDPRHWVHSIRTLVLTDAEDRPDCLVVIINDETERFNAEERFEKAFAANPAPAIIARLADMRYVKVNRGFLELTGFLAEDLIGHSMHEIDVLRGAEKRALAVKRLHAGETIPQMEGCLELPGGTERTILLGGQPLQIGDEPCMLFTFADLHPRHLAQHALKHSEERFAKAFHLAPGPMAIFALDGLRFMDVNTAFTKATGWRPEEVVGRGEADLELWGPTETRETFERQLRETGRLNAVDVQLRAKEGPVGNYLVSAETAEIHGTPCVLSIMLDITERKRTETALLAAVQSVMQDSDWLGQKIVERMADLDQSGTSDTNRQAISGLPARARDVLEGLAQGWSDEQIAEALGISRNTVRNHVSAIFEKVGVRKRAQLIVWARERGLGTQPRPAKLPIEPKARAVK